jgi:Flp pilus assembly protein TadD
MERHYEDASRLFAGYVAGHQENAWGFYMLGLSSWKSGNREAAEKAFGQALELDRGHVKSWVNLGRVLLELERPDEALQNIDEALALKPESNDALRTRGRALDELGRTDDAVAAYTDALLVDEEDAWSMNNMGLAYIRSERFDKALPPLARAVELRDDVAVFYNNLGIALERSGYTAQAAAAYTSAVSIDSTYAKASANLARVEGIETDSAALSVDLDRLAVEFADEIVRRMANGNTDSTFETPDKDAGEAESEDAAEDAEAAKEAQVPVELEDEVDAIDLIKGEANGAQAYQRPPFAPADSKR